MKVILGTVLFLAAASAVSSPAFADHQRPYADASIREMTTRAARRGLWRALVVVERTGPALIVEGFRRTRGGQRLVRQHRFDHFELPGHTLRLGRNHSVYALHWSGRQLEFSISGSPYDVEYDCRLALRRRWRAPVCQRRGVPAPTTPPVAPASPWPAAPTMGGDQAWDASSVVEACQRAAVGDEAERRCVEATRGAAGDPTRTIEACERAMGGDDAEIECIRRVSWRSDAPQIIEACSRNFGGDENELRCLSATNRLRGDAVAIIEACKRAHSGEESELACLLSTGHSARWR